MGGAKINDPFTPSFAKFVHDTLQEWKLAGVSVAVVDGEDTFAKGFGYATLPDTRATPKTLWYGGSTTKAFVTAVLAHMIDSKEYPALTKGWKTTIASIIHDDFVTPNAWATENLTLEDAASHRTGLSNNDTTIRVEEDGRQWTVKDIVRNLRNFPLRADPRTEFDYNNEGYAVLSHVVETLTQKPLKDVIQEVIWDPLEMNDTYLDLQEAKDAPEHLSTGYYWDSKTKRHVPLPFIPTGILSGAGAIISNVVDYAKWLRCLLRKEKPLSKEVHKEIRTPRFIHNPLPEHGMDVSLYGLGWWRTSIYGRTVYWHSGSTDTHGALIYWLPDLDYGVVILGNHANPAREVIMRRIVEDRLDISPKDRYDIADDWRKRQQKMQQEFENASDILFPNRPEQPDPPSLAIPEWQGKYHAPGYGIYDFSLQESKDLVAVRKDLVWQMRITLKHVSGNFWVAFISMLNGPGTPISFLAAEFKIGVDGKPSALELTFPDRDKVDARVVLFKRIR